MNDERRHDERIETPVMGLLRNVTQNSDVRAATIKNVSRRGFLLETWLRTQLDDAVEFQVEGLTFAGHVIHYQQAGDRWLVGIQIHYRLEDEQIRKILRPFHGE
jgi:hypothetical protein